MPINASIEPHASRLPAKTSYFQEEEISIGYTYLILWIIGFILWWLLLY